MTVLNGELAIKQSITIIRLFKSMKDYISSTVNDKTFIFEELLSHSKMIYEIGNTQKEHSEAISEVKKEIKDIKNELKIVMSYFNDPSTHKQLLLFNGQRVDALLAYRQIFSMVKELIILIDDYVNLETLALFRVCSKDVHITICSDNGARDSLTDSELATFIKETGISVTKLPSKQIFHDRFIVIDYKTEHEIMYDSGPSLKDAGNRIGAINIVNKKELFHPIIDYQLSEQNE